MRARDTKRVRPFFSADTAMQPFQKTVLTVAIVLLIVWTVVMAYWIHESESDEELKWPPVVAACPYYYHEDGRNCVPDGDYKPPVATTECKQISAYRGGGKAQREKMAERASRCGTPWQGVWEGGAE